jgi:starch phosphorylase
MTSGGNPHPASDLTVEDIRRAAIDNLFFHRGQAVQSANPRDVYFAASITVRDLLMRRWRRTVEQVYETNPKFVYYLSAEYLLGRQLPQNLLYTGITDLANEALQGYGPELAELIRLEREPGLGNGGLGRLAACYLDSLATLDIPAVGYGIRYEYGIFRQSFRDGWQAEGPDEWLRFGNPWEFAHPDDAVEVQFGGHTESATGRDGEFRVRWIPAERLYGEPYHTMVPGYGTGTVNMLRLWGARAWQEFNFQFFDEGDYARAVEEKINSENLTKVLYPNDDTPQGRELRLRQQYFFVACSLQDIIRRFHIRNDDWDSFPDKVVIQLNDTHPVVAVPELMRLLVDVHRLPWTRAWDITTRTFASTQHTLLPEALEKWPVDLLARLLPRHLEIIEEINRRFLAEVRELFPGDTDRIVRMSIFEEHPVRQIRMAHLACVGSFSVNGVAELQTHLLRERVFRDFAEMWPGRFNNKTNGVSPRRFMRLANPGLSDLITDAIGPEWLRDLDLLENLETLAEDASFGEQWRRVKRTNKERFARTVSEVAIDPESMFDVMVKRLHEYKRQLLKVMHIISLHNRIRANPGIEIQPRTFVFGAKAAPGYRMAKLIIKLINSVAETINENKEVAGRLQIVFVPNFNVSTGERIYPAADLSEQISMAGMEASGTGNMKLALNGALTIGTLDGANIEIRERVGADNFFEFGLSAAEAIALKEGGYHPRSYYEADEELRTVVDAIAAGRYSRGETGLFAPIVADLLDHDRFLAMADYRSYVDRQDEVDRAFRDIESWTRSSILNTARCGFFSSDRAIRQYCDEIWKVSPIPVALDDGGDTQSRIRPRPGPDA